MAGLIHTEALPTHVTTDTDAQTPSEIQTEAVPLVITVERSMASAVDANLGLDCSSGENGLLITHVKEGLISKWNKENPCLAVKAGDCICAVNHVTGHGSAMVDEIVAADILKIEISRKASGDANHGTRNFPNDPAIAGDDPFAFLLRFVRAVSTVPAHGSLPLTTEVLAIFTALSEKGESMVTKPRYVPDMRKPKWKLKNAPIKTTRGPVCELGLSPTLTISTTATNPVWKDCSSDSMSLGSGVFHELVEMEAEALMKTMVAPGSLHGHCIGHDEQN